MSTTGRIRQRFVEEGLEAALVRKKPDRHYPRKLDGEGEAKLTMLACSKAPDGRKRWTAQLLANNLVLLGYDVSRRTVQRTLKKTRLSRG